MGFSKSVLIGAFHWVVRPWEGYSCGNMFGVNCCIVGFVALSISPPWASLSGQDALKQSGNTWHGSFQIIPYNLPALQTGLWSSWRPPNQYWSINQSWDIMRTSEYLCKTCTFESCCHKSTASFSFLVMLPFANLSRYQFQFLFFDEGAEAHCGYLMIHVPTKLFRDQASENRSSWCTWFDFDVFFEMVMFKLCSWGFFPWLSCCFPVESWT